MKQPSGEEIVKEDGLLSKWANFRTQGGLTPLREAQKFLLEHFNYVFIGKNDLSNSDDDESIVKIGTPRSAIAQEFFGDQSSHDSFGDTAENAIKALFSVNLKAFLASLPPGTSKPSLASATKKSTVIGSIQEIIRQENSPTRRL